MENGKKYVYVGFHIKKWQILMSFADLKMEVIRDVLYGRSLGKFTCLIERVNFPNILVGQKSEDPGVLLVVTS